MNYLRSIGLALIGTLAVAGTGCSEEPVKTVKVRPVRTMRVGDSATFDARSFPGQAKATEEVMLSFRVSGPLITRPVKIGDEVKAGQIVARIDPQDFEVNLRTAEARLEHAKVQFRHAEKELARVQRIRVEDSGAASETMEDERLKERDRLKAEVRSLEASVQSAQNSLSYTFLKAPFDGRVVATYVENFEDVRPKQPIVRILDMSKVEMWVDVPEGLISLAPYVTEIRIEFDAFSGREIPARIKEIVSEASERTRTYPVNLIMDQPEDIRILPGMAGSARGHVVLPGEAAAHGFEIPITAVLTDDNKNSYVWVIDENAMVARRQQVVLGEMTSRGVHVQGLAAGQLIATAGANTLREGQRVRVLTGEPKEGF